MPSAAPAKLVPRSKQDSLAAWFEIYMRVEAGEPGSNTWKAKRRDLELFLNYLVQAVGTDHPDQWTRSLTEGFLSHLRKRGGHSGRGLAPTTVNRALASIKHAAGWIHRQRPFLAGHPCHRVNELALDDPDWRGLADLDVNRLKSAAEQLCHIQTRGGQTPLRNRAVFLILLHTALRASEVLSLDLRDYDGKYLKNIKRKGKKVTRKMLLAKPAREALEHYLDEERGRSPGPLITSATGNRIALQNLDSALKGIAAQASKNLAKKDRIHLSAHMLRHTALRRVADKHGLHYAMKVSGHTSSRYIWRYTQPPQEEEDRALEELF